VICAGMTIGAPRVDLAALVELERLLIGTANPAHSRNDVAIVREEGNEVSEIARQAHPPRSGTGPHGGHFVTGFRHREAVAKPAQRRLCQQGHKRDRSILGTARCESQIEGLMHYVFSTGLALFLAFIYFEPGGRRILPCGLFNERQSEAHAWCCAFSALLKNPLHLGMHVSSVADVLGDRRYPPHIAHF
jgi:hypothetical protein